MKAIRYFVITCWAILSFSLMNAQQEVLYTQYFFSQLVINPAYAGNHDGFSLSGLVRKQWFGIEGTPTTTSLLAHTLMGRQNSECRIDGRGRQSNRRRFLPSSKNNQVGLGLVVFNDRIGVSNTFLSSLSYSYKINFNHATRLSFGLQTTVLQFSQMLNRLENPEIQDPVFQENIDAVRFNFGTGVFFETERYFFGASVPQLFENNLHPGNIIGEKQLRQYFFTGGYLFYLSRKYKFKPTFLVRHTDHLPFQFDLNANVLYKEAIWAGVSYRNNRSLNFLTKLLLTGNLSVGVAYDYPLGEIYRATYGSAEVMVNYVLPNAKKRIIHPRYF